MDDRRLESSGDPGHGPVAGEFWTPPPMPQDQARMGLTRNTEEGAWIEFASMLDNSKPAHVLVAWLMLAVFCIPVLMTLKYVLGL